MNDYGEMFYGTLPPDTQDFRQVLAGIGRTLRERATAAGQRIIESGQEARALQNQAFGDPTNPLRITDENALARLTDMIMGGPLGFAPAGITAFHGSPYLFRQFDPAKIGAGEGAQAYGVGAGYTAEARPVAEEYARNLANRDLANQGRLNAHANAKRLVDFTGDPKYAADDIRFVLETNPDNPQKELLTNTLRFLESGKYKEPLQTTGYVYKGDIPDEILPKFLDWDKPLSQQSKEIQNVAKELLPKLKTINPDIKLDGMTGEGLYRSYQAYRGNQPNFASEGLESMGIRGIRYLDQGSRGEGKGTSNFIPFRAEDYKIQEINDIPIEQWYAKGLLEPGNTLPKQYDDVTKLPIPKEFGGLKTEDYLFHGGVKGKLTPSEITSFSKSPQEALEYTTISGGDIAAIPKSALKIYEGGNEKLTQAALQSDLEPLKKAGYDGFDLQSIYPGGYREVMVWNIDKALDKAVYAPVRQIDGEIGITQPLKSLLD